jgi:uncharacterized protein (TIGR01319 family)
MTDLVRAPAAATIGAAWSRGLLVDVGSTFTKVSVIEPDGRFVASAHARTTIEGDVLDGVRAAVDLLPHDAGGLRMASIGLTAALSGQAGTLAALGAGAKVVATEAGYLDDDAVARIAAADPHLVLLSGGLDGGNEDALVHNAGAVSRLPGVPGIILAGNAAAAQRALRGLASADHDVRVVDNVFPRPGEVVVAPTREVVRELFLQHITRAKGLEDLMRLLQTDCEPTPLAVSRALWELPDGDDPVVLVDVGGATTDVHSVGGRQYQRRNVDLPVPDVLRTVEGDLGMRWGAPGVVDAVGADLRRQLEVELSADLLAEARRRHEDPGFLPVVGHDRRVDEALATAAIATAIERHSGRIVVRHQPWGDRYRVVGKDLRRCGILLATGGVFRHLDEPVEVIRRAIDAIDGPFAPKAPRVGIDWDYSLYAVGLVARLDRRLSEAMARTVLATAA